MATSDQQLNFTVRPKIRKYKVKRSNYLMNCLKKDFKIENVWGKRWLNCRDNLKYRIRPYFNKGYGNVVF